MADREWSEAEDAARVAEQAEQPEDEDGPLIVELVDEPAPQLSRRPSILGQLDSRDYCKLLCSVIGGLADVPEADMAELRTAVRWCAQRDELWHALAASRPAVHALTAAAAAAALDTRRKRH